MAKRRRKSKKIKGVPALLVLIIALIVTFFGVEENPGKLTNTFLSINKAYVHFIDVGQGSCSLIQSGEVGILIDCGEADYSESVVDYIKSCGVEKLEYVVVSHPHSDHMGGMTDILDEFTVGEIIMSELSEINIPTSRLYENFITYIDENDISVSFCEYGDVYTIDGVNLEIFGPVEQVKDLNDMSVICKATVGESSFLFLGDAEKQELKSVSKRYPDINCDVITMGHHGSKASIYEDFLDKANADIAIVSCGKGNSYGHPHTEALEYIDDRGMTLYRTDIDGTTIFECSSEGFERVE